MSTRPRALARPFTLALIAALAVLILPGGTARPVAAVSTDLFFSEYIEGSSNNKALEIYNDTGAAVDLTAGAYNVQMFFNGGTTAAPAINLTGTVAQGDVFVLAQATATLAPILAQADQLSTASWFNGDDAVVLRKGTTDLDVIGQIGVDPGTEWGLGLTSTADNTLLRLPAVTAGDPDGTNGFNPAVEWEGQATDYVARLGAHPGFPPEPGPSVLTSSPTDQATDVPTNAPITVTFSEPVTVDANGASIDCIDASFGATGNAAVWEFTYLPPLPIGTTCTITIEGDSVHDVDANDPFDTMAADVFIEFTTVGAGDPCDDPFTPIPSIQGSGGTAAINGSVTVQGVVTGDYEGTTGLRGFYLQGAGDGDPATSDGIFIFNNIGGTSPNLVNLGDVVRVSGNAGENQNQTQVSALSLIACGTTDTVAPVEISFPAASPTALEAFEGMLVRVPETMTVTEHFQLGRFGQVVVSSEGRLQQPTAVVGPGAPAADLQAQNNLRKIIVDDELQTQNPDPIRFGRDGQPLSATNTLRGGDTIEGLTGVMTYTWAGNSASGNAYRIRPINALGGEAEFEAVNDRPGATVEVAGDVRVVGMNLLNYFNTFDGLPDTVDNCDFGLEGPPADCRGADSQTEFDRQWPKTVAAILSVDADVIGVNEIENDGYGPDSALAHLVGKLNEATAPGTYAYIDVDAGTGQVNAAGTDAIKVGVIYRPEAVTPVGTTAALNSVEFVNGGDDDPRSRPSIAQAFETTDGARFIVDVNHLKSKGSACDLPDQGDGQANCSVVRTNAAEALASWLASDPTGTGDADILIVGDLNSYANEDPIVALEAAGFVDLVAEFVEDPYSYVFDGQWGYLDYAMGTSSALDQVAGIVEWHINADEPAVLDYNTDFKTAGQLVSLYAPDRFRVSDHDPIVVGLDADSDRPEVDAGGPYEVEEGGTTQLSATGSDPTDDDITYAWDLDGDGSFETDGQIVTFEAGTLQAPHTVTVTVRITDEHGQSSSDTADIRVIWDFGGYQSPANAGGVTLLNAGASLPVKFSLDGDQGLAILDGDPTFQRHACPTGATIGSPITAVASEPFAYEAATDTYRFTWKTDKAWTSWCGTLTVALADGEAYTMEVRFKP